jgi:hypothetical protein
LRGDIVKNALLEYYRCPDTNGHFRISGELSEDAGHFRWGQDVICYGRTASGFRANRVDADLYDISGDLSVEDSKAVLPFNADEVIENLRRERYSAHFREPGSVYNAALRHVYYALRPYLSVPIRKYLQQFKLRKWKEIHFPEWPVDCTVDRMHRRLMALAMRAQGIETMPFIWFWPDNYTSCVIITHDVESTCGRDFCGRVMDLDESFGFRSSFQVVPENRYTVPTDYLDLIASRGFEVNVHDLKHDGRLYAEHDEFLRRASRINDYAREFGACGFRSGVLYRNADWYDAFDFAYDMSIPNVGHLDPQRGGCCTVMPYLIGRLVELPLTCTQDYTLFHMLNDYSTNLWKQQISLIMANHGLVTILVHPDYIIESRAQECYKNLLGYLSELRDTSNMWASLPRDVAQWWRQRSQMTLVLKDGIWQIEGAGSERARVAYARIAGDGVTYSLQAEELEALSSLEERRCSPLSEATNAG